ncbi:MAG: hypothetical protein ACRYFS_19640 [Janthinobacterium lividum]
MALLGQDEREELVELIAQAVVDRIEERERVNRLADLVVERVLKMQSEELSMQGINPNA